MKPKKTSAKIPVLNKQEFLDYTIKKEDSIAIVIGTNSGAFFKGYPIQIGESNEDGKVLILQQIKENNHKITPIIHIQLRKIETIIFETLDDGIDALTKGSIKLPPNYTFASKLQVKRKLKDFSDKIEEVCNMNFSLPLILNFSEDEKVLNRYINLIEIIEKCLLKILKEKDANEVWKSQYTGINFIDKKDGVIVSKKDQILEIHYPFNDLLFPEIEEEHLTNSILKLM